MRTTKPILVIVFLMLTVGMACSLFSGGTTSPTTSPTLPPAATSAPAATGSQGNSGNSSGAVAALNDAQNAVIQIESDGTFVDPKVGLVVNGAGRGSGFIIDPSGIAVTNNHVVTGAALLKVWVNGKQYNARILGVSECSDLAAIKIDGGPFPYLKWYGDTVKTGLEVYSAGFPLGDPQYTLTKGIISKEKADGESTWASLDYMYQHDATINPGNSGGPLITSDGQVVGVNNSVNNSARNQNFAIPEELARPMIDQLTKGQDVNSLGINGTSFKVDKLSGIWVASVKSGSPADKAGIKPGDILYQLENLVLATDGSMKDYCTILKSHKPEDTLALSVIRYSTGELLEGQINGRELKVTGTFDVSGAGGGTGSNTQDPSATQASGGSSAAQSYFTDDFTGNLDNYSYFEFHEKYQGAAADNSLAPTTSNGALVFNIPDAQKWVYVLYDPYTYTDVRLDMKADNRGKNSNAVSLVCRYSNEGWYEANVQNDGLYFIAAYSVADGKYFNLYNGGSTLIKQGKGTNTYTFICSGSTLTLGVNGTEVKTVTDSKYDFQQGKVGLSVSSFDSTPIIVDISPFQVSKP